MMVMKKETWEDELTFEAVEATYGTAQTTTKAPIRGSINTMSIRRSGDGEGTVTVQVYEDTDKEKLLLEVDFEDLDGDGAVDVWGDAWEPIFRSPDGLTFQVKDSADTGDDDIILSPRGERHHGA